MALVWARMRAATTMALVLSAAAVLGSCGDAGTGLGAGESCVRTAQCGDGLACVAGVCSRDVGALAEAGMVPDAGGDGAVVDMDGGDLDAGPGVDSGPPPTDSGPPPADSGPPDSGPPDSGPPDSGPPDSGPPDSGSTDPDAGTDDAGT